MQMRENKDNSFIFGKVLSCYLNKLHEAQIHSANHVSIESLAVSLDAAQERASSSALAIKILSIEGITANKHDVM